MLNKLQEVFRNVFQNEGLIITMNTSPKDIKMWDSLTHLELLSSVEDVFNIEFSFNEVMQFNTAGDIINAIEKK